MEDNAKSDPGQTSGVDRGTDRSDSVLMARLKHILETPGISDKDRKLVESNLKRLLEAQDRRKTS